MKVHVFYNRKYEIFGIGVSRDSMSFEYDWDWIPMAFYRELCDPAYWIDLGPL